MESNFDNNSFINELDPQRHIARKNNWILVLGTMAFVSSLVAAYCYYKMTEIEKEEK